MVYFAIFASGSGSNALRLMEHFSQHPSFRPGLVVTNRSGAGVIAHADAKGVPALHFAKETFAERPQEVVNALLAHHIQYIALAGFLLKVPPVVLEVYAQRIVNIHPSLLPKYGGHGMYGDRVHQAVLSGGETHTGITIHRVNEHYDQGEILLQWKVPVLNTDNVYTLQQRVLSAEHYWYPLVLMRLLMDTFPER